VEYFEKQVTINTRDNKKKNVKISLWDTAGQERFKAIANVYYKKAVGAVIVYDITKKETFLNTTSWYKEVMDKGEEGVQCILIGNKLDLSHLRQVDEKEGKNFASRHGLQFFECSAKENTNIEEAFLGMVESVYNKGRPITFEDVFNVVREKTKQLDNDLKGASSDVKEGKCC
jgi:Ras-related protein Rab-11A